LVGRQEGHPACKKWGDGGGGHWLVWIEWHPARLSVCLPLLIFPCTIKSRSSLLAPAHPGGPGKSVVKRLWCGGGGAWSIIINTVLIIATKSTRVATHGTWLLITCTFVCMVCCAGMWAVILNLHLQQLLPLHLYPLQLYLQQMQLQQLCIQNYCRLRLILRSQLRDVENSVNGNKEDEITRPK